MNAGSYDKLLQKEKRYKKMQEVLDDFESTILGFAENEKITAVYIVEEEGGILYIDYFNRTIRILFRNNFNDCSIEFYLEIPNKNNNGFNYVSVVTVISDIRGNVKCKTRTARTGTGAN